MCHFKKLGILCYTHCTKFAFYVHLSILLSLSICTYKWTLFGYFRNDLIIMVGYDACLQHCYARMKYKENTITYLTYGPLQLPFAN